MSEVIYPPQLLELAESLIAPANYDVAPEITTKIADIDQHIGALEYERHQLTRAKDDATRQFYDDRYSRSRQIVRMLQDPDLPLDPIYRSTLAQSPYVEAIHKDPELFLASHRRAQNFAHLSRFLTSSQVALPIIYTKSNGLSFAVSYALLEPGQGLGMATTGQHDFGGSMRFPIKPETQDTLEEVAQTKSALRSSDRHTLQQDNEAIWDMGKKMRQRALPQHPFELRFREVTSKHFGIACEILKSEAAFLESDADSGWPKIRYGIGQAAVRRVVRVTAEEQRHHNRQPLRIYMLREAAKNLNVRVHIKQ